jgi:hypothetical protein
MVSVCYIKGIKFREFILDETIFTLVNFPKFMSALIFEVKDRIRFYGLSYLINFLFQLSSLLEKEKYWTYVSIKSLSQLRKVFFFWSIRFLVHFDFVFFKINNWAVSYDSTLSMGSLYLLIKIESLMIINFQPFFRNKFLEVRLSRMIYSRVEGAEIFRKIIVGLVYMEEAVLIILCQ